MDVVALGELLIDFTENGTSAQDNKLFEANPGGAPCNVLAMLQKLGHQTAFIGKVGQDAFGRLLVDAVKEQGIDTTGVRYDDNVHTTLAFVQTILKISDDEIEFMTGEKDIKTGVKKLIDEYHIPFICATMGKNGSMAFFDGHIVEAAPFLRDDTVETTGAGDTFCACLLHDVLEHGINDRKDDDVKKMLTFANAAASLITTRKGALRVMPEKGEVEAVIK